MKKLKVAVAIACALPALALASSWPLYDEFMQEHLSNGALIEANGQILAKDMAYGLFLAVANNDKASFDAMYEVYQKLLCDNDVHKALPSAVYPIADERYSDPQAVMLASYSFIEASSLWNEKALYQSAISQLGILYDHCIASVDSIGEILVANNDKQTKQVDLVPAAIPPFAVHGITKADPRFAPVIHASYQTMVRGFGDGYATDAIELNTNGDVIFTQGKGASLIGSDFLLYLGISSDADPQKRLLAPVFNSLKQRMEKELFAPYFVDLFSHDVIGEAPIDFDIAMLNLSSGNIRDLLRTRIKNAPRKQLSLTSKLAALIAIGIDERRFMLDAQGSLRLRP